MQATFTFLGTGTSCGVPQLGCRCSVCTSSNPRDRRYRTSALLETSSGTCLLFDCGPDFRSQMLDRPFHPLQGVLITHIHYDHTGGLDDLRPYARGDLPLYAGPICASMLRQSHSYFFAQRKYPGVPNLSLHVVEPHVPFRVGDLEVLPIKVNHGKLPILGYRIGRLAYLTDVSSIPTEGLEQLQGVKTLVLNALRQKPHPSHQTLAEALSTIAAIKPEAAWLVHMSHEIGLHEVVNAALPPGVYLAYDGLEIKINL